MFDKTKMMEQWKDASCMDLYAEVVKRMNTALLFHSSLSDYFNFLGLHGFKRIHEYQYFCESIEKRKLQRKVLDVHNKIVPMVGHEKPEVIPVDWYKHTRMDIDDNVIAKYVRQAMKTYKEWEEESKCIYECIACIFLNRGELIDYEIMMCYAEDVQEELKKIYRLCEELNGVGYDTLYIMEIQKCIHNEYKCKMKHLKIQN